MSTPTPEVTHGTAAVNGVRLHYVTAGAGDPVVLLHGWPQSWYEWRHLIPKLAEHYTVVAPDLRGFGDSDKPAAGYDKRTVAEDVYQIVRHLKLGPVKLVGHDLGAEVAYAYAAAHPDEVTHLALAETDLAGFGLEGLMDAAAFPMLWHFGFFRAPNVAEAVLAGRERAFVAQFVRGFAYDPSSVTEADLDEYARGLASPGGLRGGFEHYRAIPADAEHNRELARHKLPMPVLAMGGDGSLGDRLVNTMHRLAVNVRGFVFERTGHWIPEERPAELADQLLTFFRS